MPRAIWWPTCLRNALDGDWISSFALAAASALDAMLAAAEIAADAPELMPDATPAAML